MKRFLVLAVALAAALPVAAFGRGGGMGGMGSHHFSATTGGAFGSSPIAPGTNSLGTGNPAVDREDARVARQVESICRGC